MVELVLDDAADESPDDLVSVFVSVLVSVFVSPLELDELEPDDSPLDAPGLDEE